MASPLYCVQHAQAEVLVVAAGLSEGVSTCGAHSLDHAPAALPGQLLEARCTSCETTDHRAYFIVNNEPVCIRHAADAVFPDDDMGAHDMAHAAYIELNRQGVADAY